MIDLALKVKVPQSEKPLSKLEEIGGKMLKPKNLKNTVWKRGDINKKTKIVELTWFVIFRRIKKIITERTTSKI